MDKGVRIIYKLHINKLFYKYLTLVTLYNIALGVWSGTIYLYMKNIGYSYSQINLFLIIFWLCTFIAELPSGMLSDYFGNINVFILSCLIRSIGLFCLIFAAGHIWILLLCAMLTGVGDSLFSGTLDSWFVNKAKKVNSDFIVKNSFSIANTVSTTFALLAGFLGAQYLANINLSYPIIIGSVILLLPIFIALNEMEPIYLKQFKFSCVSFSLSGNLSKNIVKSNKPFFYLSWAFLPITFIVAGPFNQWQLMFQTNGHKIETGWILIGVNICGVLGSGLSSFLNSRSHKIIILIFLSFLMAITMVISVSTSYKILAILFFLMHVLITSTDEVFRYTILHNNISGNNRTTLISFNNTLNAGANLVVLFLNGWLSDTYSIRFAWKSLAIVGFTITFISYLILMYKFRKKETT
ncbi:MFS transporter [Apilactobacillus xinyiensis]|uniref:MFS transporter n=1 Tax=Apilactobacillus xinyiensis TaxID=2841032 RepID=UPI003365282A